MMNNIEKLAIEHGAKYVIDMPCEYYKFTPEQLEAFSKAYAQQQSEPVWILSRDNKGRTTNIISGFPTKFDISKLPDGTELYATPPNAVPVEKYNKLLEAVKELLFESQEYHFDDGLGQGALQQYWDNLQNAYDEVIGEAHFYD